jgi:PAS domain S-box-containing protein
MRPGEASAKARAGETDAAGHGARGENFGQSDVFTVVFAYVAFAAAWIVLSDGIVSWLFSDPGQIALVSTLKGWLYVAVTALLLYAMLQRLRNGKRADSDAARSSRRTLAAILAAVLVVIGAVVATGIVQSYRAHGRDGGERLRAVAELKRELLGSMLRERRADADFLHSSQYLAGRYAVWRERGDASARRQLFERLEEFRQNFRYAGVLLIDAAGVHNRDGMVDADEVLRMHGRTAMRDGQIVMHGPYTGADGSVWLDFVVPLGPATDRPQAAVVLRVDAASTLFRITGSWPLPSASGEAILVRRDGDDVLFLSESRHRSATALNLRRKIDNSSALAAQVLRDPGLQGKMLEGHDYRDARVVGVVVDVPGSDWLLVVKEDHAEVFQGALRETVWIALLGSMALLITLSGTFLLRQQRELNATRREKAAQAERLRALQLLDALASGSSDVMFAKDREGRYLMFNPEACRFFGCSADEVVGHTDAALFPPEQVEQVRADDHRIMAAGQPESYEESLDSPVGRVVFHTTKGPLRNEKGEVIGVFGVARDVTEKARTEAVLRSVNRALRTLGEASFAMLRASDERELFGAICHVAVEHGGYRMAWAGFAGQDENLTVRPVAEAGFESGYLESIHISWGDNEQGQGPTGTAIRERRPVVARNILTDPRFEPWRDAAIRRGYASSIALPLLLDDECLGALSIYASEADAFDDDEVQLLAQLAADLARGLRTLRDRAAKEVAEAALRRTGERLARLIDASATILYSLQPVDGTLVPTDVSGNLTRIFGYTVDEALQPGWWDRCLHPDDRAAAQAAGAGLAEAGQITHEYRFAHKDGHYLWVRDIMRLLRDADGRIVEVVGVWLDVTERRQAEAELERLSRAVEQSSESIVIANVDGTIEYVNQAFVDITGFTREEILGRMTDMLDEGVSPSAGRAALRAALAQGEAWKGELQTRRRDGSVFVEFAVVSPVRGADGRVTHFVAVKEDITEKKRIGEELDRHRRHLEELVAERTRQLQQAKEEAEAASRAKSAFLANVSHEIRTPMNAIVGLAHLLQQSTLQPEQAERLHKINVAAYQLLSIINDVLDLSKIEAGRLTLSQSSFAVASVIDYVRSMIHEQAADKGLLVESDAGDAPAWLRGDPTRLRQALLNLAGNAVKFTDRGSITLRTRLLGEEDGLCLVRFEVLDTGIGIDAETLKKLFQPFEQGDASTTRRFGGTGLGLAITRQLAQAMGGEAGAESEPGKGSLFWFSVRLPRATAGEREATLAIAGSAADALRQRCAGARVLLVEDNPINREVALELLRDAGLVASAAENGQVAVDRVAGERFDLVLMDIQMPVLDGIEATRLIREQPEARGLPIVAMTANAFEEDRQRCLAAGMNDFIAKPIDPQRFYATLQQWLQAREEASMPAPVAVADSVVDPVRQRLATIPGLDIEQGLSVALGRVERLQRLLGLFAQSHGRDIVLLQEALASHDLSVLKHVAHSLKGAAGTLGALPVQGAATELLEAVREDADPARLRSLAEGLIEALQPLLDGIAALSDGPAPARTVDPATAAALVERLRAMLVRGDFAVADLVRQEGDTLRAGLGARGDDVLQRIAIFDYDWPGG